VALALAEQASMLAYVLPQCTTGLFATVPGHTAKTTVDESSWSLDSRPSHACYSCSNKIWHSETRDCCVVATCWLLQLTALEGWLSLPLLARHSHLFILPSSRRNGVQNGVELSKGRVCCRSASRPLPLLHGLYISLSVLRAWLWNTLLR